VGDCPQHFFLERYAEAFQTALESFVRAVLMRAQMPVTGHDGLAALYLAEKANESLVTGESVTFNLSDDLAAYL
jgi:myo-inositol 2-dehydrogenase/D-chiro-inositol 1-dehydrogenase